ncbi:MAG: YEATS-associated helix-containing protein [Kiloniellales bacterium]
MTQWQAVLLLVTIMVASGLAGGIANYALSLEDDNANPKGEVASSNSSVWGAWHPRDPRLLWRSVITGVVAAFIVPLFLRLSAGGTDDLITNVLADCSAVTGGANAIPPRCGERAADFFVIAAFCLIAAVSARAFIQTVSERILQQAREANRRAEEAQQDVAEIQEDLSERELDTGEATEGAAIEGAEAVSAEQLDENSMKLLMALEDSKYTRRSTSGLAGDTKLNRARVLQHLDKLVASGHIEKTTSRKDGTARWRITSHGRTAVLRHRLQ